MRIFAFILGVLLLLPGACFLVVGFRGFGSVEPTFVTIGIFIIIAAGVLFYAASRRR